MLRDLLVSLAMHRLLLKASTLLCLPCRGLHVLPARLSLHGLGLRASPCCSAATWGSDRACTRSRPSLTSGGDSWNSPDPFSSTFSLRGHILSLWIYPHISWNICTRISYSLLGRTELPLVINPLLDSLAPVVAYVLLTTHSVLSWLHAWNRQLFTTFSNTSSLDKAIIYSFRAWTLTLHDT